MGTTLQNPDITGGLDSGTDTAFLRLDVDILILLDRFGELAAPMDAERFHEAEALVLEPGFAGWLELGEVECPRILAPAFASGRRAKMRRRELHRATS